jgi:hypothetical protein
MAARRWLADRCGGWQGSGRPVGRQVSQQLVQVSPGAGADRLADPLAELVLGQPPSLEVLAELCGGAIPVGVGHP